MKGPIFANLILGDEINRAPAKTQAAMLEAMQERQVTLEGETFPPEPFVVLATQNPIEYEGTFPLPEAQLTGSWSGSPWISKRRRGTRSAQASLGTPGGSSFIDAHHGR